MIDKFPLPIKGERVRVRGNITIYDILYTKYEQSDF